MSWFAKGGVTLALAAACTAVAFGDSNTGSIYGWVYVRGTHTGVCPLAMRTHSNRESDWHTMTGKGGWFQFLTVHPGPVEVIAGHGLETRTVEVHANLPTQTILYVRARSHNCPSP